MKEIEIVIVNGKEYIIWTTEKDILNKRQAAFLLDSLTGIGADGLLVLSRVKRVLFSYGVRKSEVDTVLWHLKNGDKHATFVYLADNFLSKLKNMQMDLLSYVS